MLLPPTASASEQSKDAVSLQRRRLLHMAAATPLLLGAAGAFEKSAHASTLKTRAHIVIAGGGLGGIALANRLSAMLDGASISLIDSKEEHNYQPGYTLVATGIWPVDKVRNRNADYLPSSVRWIKDMVAEFDPASNSLTTAGGQRIRYDFLIVATGLHLDYKRIKGMDVAAIGHNGLASVYPGPAAAVASWSAMQTFIAKGGRALLTLPATPLKCAGAPLKMAFMVADRLRQAGTLATLHISFQSALAPETVFGVKAVNDNVLQRWQKLGIAADYQSTLVAVDVQAKRARFANAQGAEHDLEYDFLHVVPPMRAPDAVLHSDLAVQHGALAAGGWLDVHKDTLQHLRYPNVFGIGDINGTPRGKTAATVKKSAPIVAHHVVQAIAGKPLDQVFDGYTSCPLLLREGSAMLVEFDYEGRLTPSLPLVDPLQESFFAWLMKYRMLKPAYIAVFKGRV